MSMAPERERKKHKKESKTRNTKDMTKTLLKDGARFWHDDEIPRHTYTY